jgi:formylglycine-generating enzyme required for sulfatase activity
LTLNWRGIAGDQFELHFKTNLSDAWQPLSVSILTNGMEFSFVDTAHTHEHACFYRIQRLPRLELPDSMVWVPPGEFMMGTPAGDTNRTPSELQQFEASFSHGFWIGQHEVTQWEYQNVTCTNPATYSSDLNNPVEKISWPDAMDYCTRLTQRERQTGRLPDGYTYRLPSEAEWEYAARAGTTNSYSFGDDPSLLSTYGWYVGNSGARSHPAGQLQANPWGLQDIHGNVLEWCQDWIQATPPGPVTDFIGATSGPYHAVRGGGWSFGWASCRCSWRAGYAPVARQPYLGFRVVLAPP